MIKGTMLHDGDWFDCVVWSGLWNEEDGFFYDHIRVNGKKTMPLKILSMVGLVPLFSCMVLKQDVLRRHPGFYKRTRWFLNNRKDLSHHVSVKGVMMKMLLMYVYTNDKNVCHIYKFSEWSCTVNLWFSCRYLTCVKRLCDSKIL